MTRVNVSRIAPPVIENLHALGQRIVASRKIQRLRQEDLAVAAGVSRSTLAEIEKGSPFVSIGGYMSVLWALGLMQDLPLAAMNEAEQRLASSELPQRVRHG